MDKKQLIEADHIDVIVDKLQSIAEKSKGHTIPLSETENEEYNTIVRAINQLIASNLQSEQLRTSNRNVRIEEVLDVLNSYLLRDFSAKAPITDSRDKFDALALSVNYFGSELDNAFKQIDEFTRDLEDKVQERTRDLEIAHSKLKESLDKEKELGKLKSRFVSNASHQFRTPLSVIQANTQLLEQLIAQSNEDIKPKLEKYSSRIVSGINQMTRMMDEVLLLGKIDSANVKPNIESISFTELCNELALTHNNIQDDKRIIRVMEEGNAYEISLDPYLMKQALSNLISNAFKYSKGEKSPLLTVTYESKLIRVSIRDYGIGIPNVSKEQLFQPFFRASNVNGVEGTGLGLCIAKEFIEINGGSINVQSKLNQGTEFIITFDRDDQTQVSL